MEQEVCAYTGNQAGNQTQCKQSQSLMITHVKPPTLNNKALQEDVSFAFYSIRRVLNLIQCDMTACLVG